METFFGVLDKTHTQIAQRIISLKLCFCFFYRSWMLVGVPLVNGLARFIASKQLLSHVVEFQASGLLDLNQGRC